MLSGWQILMGYAVPAIVIALLLWFNPARKTAGLLFGAGFCVAYWFIYNSAGYPSTDVFHWIFYLAGVLTILAAINALFDVPLWVAVLVFLMLLRVTVRALLWPQIPRMITPAMAESVVDIAALVGAAWYVSLEKLAEKVKGVTAPLALWLTAAGSAAMLGSFFVTRSASLAAALAIFAFAAAVIAFFRPALSLARGAAGVVVFLLIAMLMHAYFYSSASDTVEIKVLVPLGLLAIAPLVVWTGDLPWMRKRSDRARLLTRLIAMGVVVAVSAGMAVSHAMQEKQKQTAGTQEYE